MHASTLTGAGRDVFAMHAHTLTLIHLFSSPRCVRINQSGNSFLYRIIHVQALQQRAPQVPLMLVQIVSVVVD